MANILKENLDNEEMCLEVSTIFRNIAKCTQNTEEAMTVYTDIGFELIFQMLSKHTKNEKMCENLLGMFDKKLNSKLMQIKDFKKRKK